jgi:AcrR family transcriptional regulator
MARTYNQDLRARMAEHRRVTVLDVAERLLLEQGYQGLGLESVAREAGVVRRTVYNQFQSKSALLEALLDSAASRAGAAQLAAAAADADADPARTARRLLVRSYAFWAAERDLFRRLIGLAAVDDEVSRAVEAREERRTSVWRTVCEHLADQDRLRPGITKPVALKIFGHLSGFPTFDALVAGTTAAAAAELAVRLGRTTAEI